MRLNIQRTASGKFKSIVIYMVSFLMVLGSIGFAAPKFFGQVAHAVAPTIVEAAQNDPTDTTGVIVDTPVPTDIVIPTPTPVDNLSPPTDSSLINHEPSATLTTSSKWTFEKVELNKEYIAPQNSGVKLTFTKLPSPAGNIKIEEITLTQEQIKQTGSLSDKAYDITSDMTDGSFSYNLSLPIPESSKGKTVEVKFAEELSNIGSAAKVENTLTKTDTSVSVTSLDHFTIFVVTILDPSWNAVGGGGVYSSYAGYPGYAYVSPGTTAVYAGSEAGIIKAGLTPEPDGHYWDDGIFGFKPTVTINDFSIMPLTYDVQNQYGENPVWMTIEIDTGLTGEANRSDNTVFQFVPTSNPTGWHTVDAGAGLWQKWNNNDGDVTGNIPISLSTIVANPLYTGLNVVRAYLRLGMGDAYNNGGTGTIAWVDKTTLGGNTYDFTVAASAPTQIPADRLPMLGTLTGVTLTPTLGKVTILNGLPATVDAVSNPALFAELEAQHPGSGSTVGNRYVGFMINPPVVAGYAWSSDSLKETTAGNEFDFGSENLGDPGTSVAGTELWQTVAVKSGDVYNREFRTPKDYEITWILQKTGSLESKAVTELFTVEQILAAPTLTIYKVCLPSSNGLERFNLQIDGSNVTSDTMCGGSTNEPIEVTIGTHTVGETGGSGTNLSNYTSVISGDCASNGSVTLAAGDNKTCTITNTVDTTPPTVTSVDSDTQKYKFTTSSPHTITVTFSENISNTPTIAVSGTGQTVTNCGDADAKTFCFAYAIPAATEYTAKTIQISGAQDAGSLIMVADNSHTFIVDTVVPTITVSGLLPGDMLPTINIANAASYTLNGTYTELGAMGYFFWRAFDVLPWTHFDPDAFLGTPTPATGTDVAWSNTWTDFFNTNFAGEGTFRIWSEVYDKATNYGHISYDGIYDLVAPTATVVAYDVTTPTNGSVVATITPSETVTGDLTHTFTSNGPFTFNFTDLAGNPGSVIATVSNIDKTAPVITLTGGASMSLTVGGTFTDPGATTDDGSAVVVIGTVNTAVAGTYTIKYSSTDATGNVAMSVNRVVTVNRAPLSPNVTASTNSDGNNGQILGTTDATTTDIQGVATKSDDKKGEVQGTSDTKKKDTSNWTDAQFLGLAWYWWILILAAAGGAAWWFLAGSRRRAE